MKRIFLSLLFIAICLFAKAQQSIDPRIQEVYGDKTQEMVGNSPVLLNFLNDLLTKRIKIEEMPAGNEEKKFPMLSQIELLNKYNPSMVRDAEFNPQTFNPLKYNLEFGSNSNTLVYRVDNTNYIIVIHPQSANK